MKNQKEIVYKNKYPEWLKLSKIREKDNRKCFIKCNESRWNINKVNSTEQIDNCRHEV